MIKASKYHNRKTLVDGIQFDSQKEANRYQELILMERAGLIRSIELQPRYDLVVNEHKIGFYRGDFRYEVVATSILVGEDVKSPIGIKLSGHNVQQSLGEFPIPISVFE